MADTVQELVVDVVGEDHDVAVAWWSAALGGRPDGTTGSGTLLVGARARVGVRVREVDDGAAGYHLVLGASDVDAEVERLVGSGAAVVAGRAEGRAAAVVDPVGVSFRVAPAGEGAARSDARESLHLRVLMVDVPRGDAPTAASFWATALGGEPVPVGDHYPDYTWIRPAHGPGGPVNVCVQATDRDAPRMHVDLHCPDVRARDEQVARLVDLGARVVDDRHHWVVLAAPGGHLACIVPDAA